MNEETAWVKGAQPDRTVIALTARGKGCNPCRQFTERNHDRISNVSTPEIVARIKYSVKRSKSLVR